MIRMSYKDALKLQVRAAAKKDRSADNARFIAKMKGKKLEASRSTLVAQIDGFWSIIVRRRDMKLYGPNCRSCKWRTGTTACHKVPKQRGYAVRWLLINGYLGCSSCNFSEVMNRSLWQNKRFVIIFGQSEMDELNRIARTKKQFSDADLIELRDTFKRLIQTGSYL